MFVYFGDARARPKQRIQRIYYSAEYANKNDFAIQIWTEVQAKVPATTVSNNRTIIVVLSFNYRDMKQSLASNQQQKWTGEKLVLVCSLLLMGSSPVQAWGSSHQSTEELVYGNRFDNDWLNGGSTLSFHVDGCAWGYTYDSEEAGCLEDESEEGTTNWYMMANCRRPQVAFSVYKGNSCSSGNFVGSVGFLLMLQCGSPAFLRSNHCDCVQTWKTVCHEIWSFRICLLLATIWWELRQRQQ